MTSHFQNYDYKYRNNKGKSVFVPSEKGRKIGLKLKKIVERRFKVDSFYDHLKQGGHISSIHRHRPNKYFAKIDLENYFYSFGRNRVINALRRIELNRAEYYSKWSCVKNPYGTPYYSLPYGFVQSPIIASLVLHYSSLGYFCVIWKKYKFLYFSTIYQSLVTT